MASLCCVEVLLVTFAFPEWKRKSAWQGSVSELAGFVCRPQGSPEFYVLEGEGGTTIK